MFDSNGDSLGTVTGQLTGPAGGIGTYTLSQSSSITDTFTAQTTTSITGGISANVLTVSSPTGSPIVAGDVVIGSGVPIGTAITAQLTGTTGGAGTYQLATLTGASLNVASESMSAQLNQTLTTATGAQLPIESNMLSPALTQPTALDTSDQNGAPSGYGSGLGHEVTTAYEMTSQHELYAPLTGDTTAGSNVIHNVVDTSPAGTPYAVGYAVDGPGIPAGAIITAVNAGSITLSQAATVTATGSSFDSWNEWTSAIDPNTIAAGGSGYTNGATVVALGGVTAAGGAPLLGTVTTSGGVVTGFVSSDATNNGFQGDAADSANWYSVLPTVPCPVTGGSGTGNPLFNLTMNDLLNPAASSYPINFNTGIETATLVSGTGGSGYTVGDVLTLGMPGGIALSGTAATLTVTAVDSSGAILAVNVKTAGSYSKDNPATLFYIAPVDGSGGSGAILSWQALQTSVPDNASSNFSPDAAIVNGGGYAAGDVLVVTNTSSFTDSQGNQATWTVAPMLQVTNYTYSAAGASFTYNLINTPTTSTGFFPVSSDTFNVFPLGYTPSTTIVGPDTFYGAGVNGGVGEFVAGATVNFGPQVFSEAAGSVIQQGSGTTILTGADTYTGATTVSAGKLFVDGSTASSTTVAASATLGGTGTIAAPVAVTGALSAGDTTIAPTGSLTVGNLSFASGSTFNVVLNGTTPGSGYDQVTSTGTINLTGSSLNLSLGNSFSAGTTFDILVNDGGSAITGTFSQGSAITVGGKTFGISYTGGASGHDVVLTAEAFSFTSGDLLVTTVGTGSSLTSSATTTFLDEYTTSGGNVSSTPLPTANSATATISGITESGTTATVTTAAASGFAVGERVTISGSSVSGYNNTFTITAVPSTTTFTISATSGLGSASGGTATVVLDLTESGTATGEGYLTDSADGHSVSIGGYNVAPGSSTSGVNRAIAVVGPNAVVDLSTQLPSSTTTRVAVSADGQGFWIATSSGIDYVPFGNPGTAVTSTTAEVGSTTAVGIDNAQLYGSAGVAAQTNGVPAIDSQFSVGNGLPTTGGNAINVPISFPNARDNFGTFPTTNQFWVSPDGNTVLIADSRTDSSGGLLEYYQATPGSWTELGHLQLDSFGIAGAVQSGTTVTITTSAATNFVTGESVQIAGVLVGGNSTNNFNTPAPTSGPGTGKTITVIDSSHFTYTVTGSANVTADSGTGFATNVDGGVQALVFNPSSNTAYATTSAASGNRIVKITGITTDGSTPSLAYTTLQTAATNTAFRGVAFTPTATGTTTSTTTLNVTGSPGNYGAGVTLAATVTSGATGWVSFRNQTTGAEIGAAPIVSGTATFVTAGNLPASTTAYNIVAVYTGDNTYAPSTSSAQSATVNQATVGVNLSAAPSPVATGVNVTLSATLTSVPAGTTPTGTVTFNDGSTTLGPGTIAQTIVNVSGSPVIAFVASFTTVFTTAGTHDLSAVYSGDTNFATATGTTSLLVVSPTYVTVTSSNADPSAAPSATVTYTATVASAAGTPTGTVQFYDNLLPIGSPVTLSSGAASVTINTALVQAASGDPDVLTPGQHAISAVYTPDTAGQNTYFTSTDDYIQNVQNQPFSAADTFVYRVGDGTTPLNPSSPSTVAGSIGSTIFVDEYTAAGTLVQSIALPTADGPNVGISAATESSTTVTITTGVANGFSAGQQVVISGVTQAGYNGTFTIASIIDSTHFTYTDATSGLADGAGGAATTSTVHAVVGNGQQSTTGQMTLSGDGQYLFVSGYDTNPLDVATAAPIPTASGSASTLRSIARIRYNGTIQELAMTAANSGSSAGNFNAVYSPNGNQVYLGGNNRVVYYSSFSPSAGPATPTATMTSPTGTTTALDVMQGNLVAVAAGPQAYTGFPTSAASTATLPGFSNAAATGGGQASTFYVDAYFTHLNGTGAPAGINTFYLADDGPSFANGAITKWALNQQGITAATESGTTVTITTAGSLSYISGQTVAIAGVGVSGYNGTFTITSVSGSTFTYTDTTGLGNSSGGTASQWKVVDHITAGSGNSMTSFYYLSGQTDSSGNVTLGVTYGNGGNSDLGLGQLAAVTDTNGWDAPIGTGGTHSNAAPIIASVSGSSNEVFRGVAAAPLAAVQSVTVNGGTTAYGIGEASESGTTVTITTNKPNPLVAGQQVLISGVSVAGYNGTFTVATVSDSTHFTYTAASGLAMTMYSGQVNATGSAISSITESSTTATVTTSAPNGFTVGEQVNIAGVTDVTGYNGNGFTITSIVSPTTFTYTAASGLGSSSGSGTATSSLIGAQRSRTSTVTYSFGHPVSLQPAATISQASENV